MKRIGQIKKKFLTEKVFDEAIHHLTSVAKQHNWTKHMTREWRKVMADLPTVKQEILTSLREQTFVFGKFNIFTRREGKKLRKIYASEPKDQIVDYILDQCLKYVFMEKKHLVHPNCYGSIKKKGQHELRYKVIKEIYKSKGLYVANLDTYHYYPTIDHEIMMNTLRKHIKDEWLLWLCYSMISRVEEGVGIPLGTASSNILGHVYHAELDWKITQEWGIKRYYRFCDDKLLMSKDKNLLHKLVKKIRKYIEEEMHQTVKSSWKVVRVDEQEIEFLGSMINSHGARLKSYNRRRAERRFRKEEKLPFSIYSNADISRLERSWAGMYGSYKGLKVKNLFKHWVTKAFPEYFRRVRMCVDYRDNKRVGIIRRNRIPEHIPLHDNPILPPPIFANTRVLKCEFGEFSIGVARINPLTTVNSKDAANILFQFLGETSGIRKPRS